MRDKKLLIADGHHRYETALAFHERIPALAGADRVMMTFVNMHSPGLKILATHRLVSGIALDGFPGSAARRIPRRGDRFARSRCSARGTNRRAAASSARRWDEALHAGGSLPRRAELDVRVLHERLLGGVLGIGEEAVRDEKHLRYIRGIGRGGGRGAEGRRADRFSAEADLRAAGCRYVIRRRGDAAEIHRFLP